MSTEATQSGEHRSLIFTAMSVDMIRFFGRAVFLVGDHDHEMGRSEQCTEEAERIYVAEMDRLLHEQPDKAKTAIRQSALSNDDHDRSMAAYCAEPLAKVDYPLARAVLLFVKHVGKGDGSSDYAGAVSYELSQSMPEIAANLSDEMQAVREHGLDGVPARLLD